MGISLTFTSLSSLFNIYKGLGPSVSTKHMKKIMVPKSLLSSSQNKPIPKPAEEEGCNCKTEMGGNCNKTLVLGNTRPVNIALIRLHTWF